MIRKPMVTLLVCSAMILVLPQWGQAQEGGGRPGRRGIRHPDGSRRKGPGGQGFRRPTRPRHPGAGMEHAQARAVQRVDELLRLLDEQDVIREKIEAAGESVPERLSQAAERIERRTHELREGLRKALSARGFGRRGGPEYRPFERGEGPGPLDRPGPPDMPELPGPPLGPPPGGAGHPGGPPHGPDRPEAALRLLGDVAPEIAAELRQLWRENPEKARRRFHDALPEMERLRRLRKDDPEAFKRIVSEKRTEFGTRRLAREARSAKGEDKERATNELREQLNKLFEVRMRGRDARIEQLEGELAKLRSDQERRRSHRDELIERRLQDLLGESLEF